MVTYSKRSIRAALLLALSANGPTMTGSHLAAMAGEAYVPLLWLMSSGSVVGLSLKGCAKESGASTSFSRSVDNAFPERIPSAIVRYSESNATTILRQETRQILAARADHLPSSFWENVYRSYPEFKGAGTPEKVRQLANENNDFVDEVALILYLHEPDIFRSAFNNNVAAQAARHEEFGANLQRIARIHNSRKISQTVQKIQSRLAKKGFTADRVTLADPSDLQQRLYELELEKELKFMSEDKGFKWDYDSGTVTVNTKFANGGTFKESVDLKKLIAATTIGGGLLFGWNVESFNWPCVGAYCVNIVKQGDNISNLDIKTNDAKP